MTTHPLEERTADDVIPLHREFPADVISGGIARHSPVGHGLPRSRPGDLTGDRAVDEAGVLFQVAAALRVAALAGTGADGLRPAGPAVDSGAAADPLRRRTRASWQRTKLEVPA
ncbi:hypothetical protein [Streptomyces griseomycini]|uniref:Uncharacterized protein n=1 Tax=Streptomyces griseomycini TaxID=66895 RepID=A0A7W7PXF3_9ACTN|nr:hypothetical protein [Streptomyces griseomycini]MBB4903122.1 hypothetical protein [Streptomyces griseomycini]